MKREVNDEQLDKKGKELFNNILTNVHNGNIDEMYKYFELNIERLKLYGDTKEKQMINYCIFKYEAVVFMYTKTK